MNRSMAGFGLSDRLDHSNRQGEFVGLVVGFTALAFVCVMARMYTRAVLVRSVGPDDWAILAGLLSLIAFATVSVLYIKWAGIGYHVWDVPHNTKRVQNGKKMMLASQTLYGLVLTFSKTSILLFYRRLTPNRVFHMLIWMTMGCTIALVIAGPIADLLQCAPIAYYWDQSIPGGHCFNQAAFYFAIAGVTILGDLWILALPMPVFWGLQISLKRRLILMSLFAVGFFVVVVSSIRLYAMHRLMLRTKDPTYDNAPVWSAIELCMSVICCAIPALRPLFSRLLPVVFGNTEPPSGKPSGLGAGFISGSSGGGDGGSNRGVRRLAGGTGGRSSRGHGAPYDLESLGDKRGFKAYGAETAGSSSNDSEEMIVGEFAAEVEHAVPPRPHDHVFDGTNKLVGATATTTTR